MNPNREEALFASALEKPATERAAWLDRECEGNPAFSLDGRWCLTLNSAGAGLIRDLTTGSEMNLNLNLTTVGSVTFSPDGKLFAAAANLSLKQT